MKDPHEHYSDVTRLLLLMMVANQRQQSINLALLSALLNDGRLPKGTHQESLLSPMPFNTADVADLLNGMPVPITPSLTNQIATRTTHPMQAKTVTQSSAMRRKQPSCLVKMIADAVIIVIAAICIGAIGMAILRAVPSVSSQPQASISEDARAAQQPIHALAGLAYDESAPIPLRAPPSISREQYAHAHFIMRTPLADDPAAAFAVYDELVQNGIDPAAHMPFAALDAIEARDAAFPPPRGGYNLHNLKSCPTCEPMTFTSYVQAVRAWIRSVNATLPPMPPSVQTVEGLAHLQCQARQGCDINIATSVMRSLVRAARERSP